MAHRNSIDVVNSSVNRESVERLQLKLHSAAEAALDLAVEEQKIPAGLLSAVQSILRDASIQPDLTSEQEVQEEENTSRWLDVLAEDVGL